MPRITSLLRDIAAEHEVVEAEHADAQLPARVAQLLSRHFARMVRDMSSGVPALPATTALSAAPAGGESGAGSRATQPSLLLSTALADGGSGNPPSSGGPPRFTPIREFVGTITRQSLAAANLDLPKQLFTVSPPAAPIPFLHELEAAMSAGAAGGSYGGEQEEQRQQALAEAVQRLASQDLPEQLAAVRQRLPDVAAAAAAEWEEAARRLEPQVARMGEVLMGTVMPPNKANRRRAALRGASLHIGGLIKAVATDWNYKKVGARLDWTGWALHTHSAITDV